MENIKVLLINKSNNPNPEYKSDEAAGMDLQAFLDSPITIEPNRRKLIPTGLHIALPKGYEGQVRPRSGLAFKNGITVLNAPGTIDSDYRGELSVLLINLSDTPFTIQNGDRIAQLIISKHETINWKLDSALPETERGSGGYGSTGI